MFQKPVQYVTTETISKLGLGHVDSEIKKESIKKEMSSKQASPFSFSKEDDVVNTQVIEKTTLIDKEESDDVLENGKIKRFRGDHILWIE